MTTSWFYMENGLDTGPVDEAVLAELAAAGRISGSTSVRGVDEQAWSRLDVRLPQIAAASPKSSLLPPEAPAGSRWTDTLAHPWRRYFARMTDSLLVGTATFAALFLILAVIDPPSAQTVAQYLSAPGSQLIGGMAIVALAMPGNALLIGLTGFTLGKWIFGVRVLRPDGRPIGLGDAFSRELDVWVRGRGLGIPLVSLLTVLASYRSLERNKFTPWDAPATRVVVHRPGGAFQTVLTVSGVILLIAVSVGLAVLS